MMAYRNNPNATEVTQEDFIKAMSTIRPSVDESVIKFYDNLAASMGKDITSRKKPTHDIDLYQ